MTASQWRTVTGAEVDARDVAQAGFRRSSATKSTPTSEESGADSAKHAPGPLQHALSHPSRTWPWGAPGMRCSEMRSDGQTGGDFKSHETP